MPPPLPGHRKVWYSTPNCLDRAKMAGQMSAGIRAGAAGEATSPCSEDPCRRAWWSFSGDPRAEGPSHVTTRLAVRHAVLPHAIIAGLALGGVTLLVGGSSAQAQGKLEAHYSVTLGGVSFGQGSWTIDVHDDQYTASVSGATVGLMRIFASGQGSSAARGTVSNGQLLVNSYASTIQTDKKYDEVRMVLNSGSVKDSVADPPSIPVPDRIPVTDAHRRGVTDPMTAAIFRVPGTGDTFTPEACQRKVGVFDGRMRYDLSLAFKRLDKV